MRGQLDIWLAQETGRSGMKKRDVRAKVNNPAIHECVGHDGFPGILFGSISTAMVR
jgi:hypothetical protein